MINQIKYIVSHQYNPYHNLALEEYLLNTVEKGTCILYLWQNERTIVIGKNQNPWKECKIQELENDGGYLVRRLSGGGAVFHDLGNLNFTFLLHKEDYNVNKQLEVILVALEQLGIQGEQSGRNDITVDDKKFSGNAFYESGGRCYHHGTILVQVDMENLSRYLNVSNEKLRSKGVDSVKSRVTNLVNYRKDLDIDLMKENLIEAFSKVYQCKAEKIKGLDDFHVDGTIHSLELEKLYHKFSSWDWIYGKKMEFHNSISKRFSWGEIELHFVVHSGIVEHCKVYSDAMEVAFIEEIPQFLIGTTYMGVPLSNTIESMKQNKEPKILSMITDIQDLIMKEI